MKMRDQIKYKTWPIGSSGVWKRGNLKELLLDIPGFYYVGDSHTFPSLQEVNGLLAQGVSDAGMSGACEWKPFQIFEEEYQELLLEFQTDPQSRFVQFV